MPYCPACGVEYREGFNQCADCDVPLVPEPVNLPLDPRQHAQYWIRAGLSAGVVLGITTLLSSVLVTRSGVDLFSAETWEGLGSTMPIGAIVGAIPGVFGGTLMFLSERYLGLNRSFIPVATVLGAVIGFCYGVIAHFAIPGLLVGGTGGFITALWREKPPALPFEDYLPLRGKWLWQFATVLLVLLMPLLSWFLRSLMWR